MRKRIALGGAIKAIREAKAKQPASETHDPRAFLGSRFSVACLMSHAHLCNIETGVRQPSEEVVHRIAAHLGVPVDAISYTIELTQEIAA